MCVGQIKECQSSGKHHYPPPHHICLVQRSFSSHLIPTPQPPQKGPVLVAGEEIKLLDWVFMLSCPAMNFDDLLHGTHFHHTKHHLCDYLIKSSDTKVLIKR